ncbi:MAG TPA: polynucleotide adenylyltransferase PcnB [Pseudomonadota bacterium]|nr:polynucleotide adenylyltransferase PcnB [Pseudomonadota bacterium]
MLAPTIPIDQIAPEAQKVIRHLVRSGHQAYLVGGCVRDLLLGRTPKDFDVATDATPSELRELFRNCRIIGRRFRLAHIIFGPKIIETATFRANPREDEDGQQATDELYIHRDNVFGTAEQDARRRDFTINGLFYDLPAEKVIDYVDGLRDLESRFVRTIGDPNVRFREDPVRMLRAVKFAARLGFDIEDTTYRALLSHGKEIEKSPVPRVLEEIFRLLRGGAAMESMVLLRECGMLDVLLPEVTPQLAAHPGLLDPYLHAIDRSVEKGDVPVNAVLVLALFMPKLLPLFEAGEKRQGLSVDALSDVLVPLCSRLKVPRRDVEQAKNLLIVQRRIAQARTRGGKLPPSVLHREELRPALGLHALVYRCQRQAEGASDAAIDSEIAAWPLPGPFFLGAGDSARSEFAPEREFRRDDRRRRSRRPEIDDLAPRPRLPEVSSPEAGVTNERAASSGDDEPLLDDEEAALAAFVAAMRSGRDDD